MPERYLEAKPELRASRDSVATAIEEKRAAVRGRLPGVAVDWEAWVDRLAALPKAIDTLPEDIAVEVALVFAFAEGDREALKILEREYLAKLPRVLVHMSLADDVVEDVGQEVRRKLLVGDPPKLREYVGKGSLRGLLKVTAVRTAISMLRKTARESPAEEQLELAASGDLELSFLKQKYRGAFSESFERAIRGLDPSDRNLLRLHFLGKVTLPALATMYGVHRATIIRRLAKTREVIEKQTRRGMREALSIQNEELNSIMDLVRSRMDISVARMLETMSPSSES